ncbi:MAG: cation-translocating P-type ATPase [Burkholderiales bacterium]|nr:cation-translocating P-type ATPase [Burkholderiales bacterium]
MAESGAAGRSLLFAVEGMHCASCVQLIEMQVGALDGVDAVHASLAGHRLRVRCGDERATLAQVMAAVARAGYRAWPLAAGSESAEARQTRRMALWRLFVAGFAMMQIMMYATPAYLAGEGELPPDLAQLMRIASFVLCVPVIGFSAAPLFASAWRGLVARRIGMDLPAVIGIAAGFGASAWATFVGGGEVYFDSVAMFVFLLLGGRYLESLARARARAAVEELARAQPLRARRVRAAGGEETFEEVDAQSLVIGDRVRIAAGEAVPADARVIAGHGLNDEALLTGESRPVQKALGDRVIAGAVNLAGVLTVQVTAGPGDSHLARMLELIDAGARAKPPLAALADRHAQAFLWLILIAAAGTAALWSHLDPARAWPAAIAVLVVTCPCALSLAAPLAMTSALASLARRGVLVTRDHAIEALARATHFVFDKTGTLTSGRMRVEEVLVMGRMTREEVLITAARLEAAVVHPIGQAIAMHAAPLLAAASAAPVLDGVSVSGGEGVEANLDGRRLRIGSLAYAQALHGAPLAEEWAGRVQGKSVAALSDAQGWLGVILLSDGVRAGAAELVADLGARGASVVLASGDTPAAVALTAAQLGVPVAHAAQKPEDKRALVLGLQRSGARVAMIGDGVNDAPVLAQADVSVAIGGGAPLAQTRADMLLCSGRPADLGFAIDMARRAHAVVRQNLWWAAVYNLVAVPLAAGGVISPLAAGLGMAASSLVVALNALRLAPRPTAGTAPDAARPDDPSPAARLRAADPAAATGA